MAFDTYSELQTEIADWLRRSNLTSKIQTFIAMAETKMSEDLDAKAMETTTTLSTVANNAYVNLPSDFRNMKRLILVSDPSPPLKYASPEELSSDYQYSETSQSMIYTIIGSQIQLAPVPGSVYSLSLVYERFIPALSDNNTTNWLLTRSPNAYLFGALMMAQPFLVNDQRYPLFQQMYLDAINAINTTDWHVGANMRVRAG